ncbi:MAG TPA: F0F1 ATP synthase subunit A [Gemmataceae bacterium]|nr:F0F1 ATP synthase subunit A [Gemmataceae bacterium]
MAHAEHDALDHVLDTPQTNDTWTFFDQLFGGVEWKLPIFNVFGHEFHLTKFMILELIAAALVMIIFIPLCRRASKGELPKGPFWNAFESLLTFVRNEIAKPSLLEDADRWVPMLWTMFVFILFCNLLGMIPMLGSPTSSFYMTLGLALFSLLAFHFGAIFKLGPVHYLQSMWPAVEIVPYPLKKPGSGNGHGHGHDGHGHEEHATHTESPAEPPTTGLKLIGALALWVTGYLFGLVISLMIFVIEFAGTFIKSAVLALRLFVNMFAGHVILASLLLMIVSVANEAWYVRGTATVLTVAGMTALSLLELFVAFMQAYVFTFLTALFLGLMLHPSH